MINNEVDVMYKLLGLAVLFSIFSGCATQTLPGKVVTVDSVFNSRPYGAGSPGADMAGAAVQGAATGGAAISSALRTGAAVGGVATVVDAIANRDKTVTVYGRYASGTKISFNQKPTPEVFRFKPGEQAVFALDQDGDLVLVPVEKQ